MEWVTWINTGVGIIGIVVGIIGWKSLSTATKIKNTMMNLLITNGGNRYDIRANEF